MYGQFVRRTGAPCGEISCVPVRKGRQYPQETEHSDLAVLLCLPGNAVTLSIVFFRRGRERGWLGLYGILLLSVAVARLVSRLFVIIVDYLLLPPPVIPLLLHRYY